MRRWRAADRDALTRVVRDCLPQLRPWLPWASGEYTGEDAAEFLRGAEEGWQRGSSFCFAITTGGAVVGGIGLEQRHGMRVCEIGYWLHPDHRGLGLVSCGVVLLVEQAWRGPVQRVQIRHDANNAASAAVPRRLGFTCVEGDAACEPGAGLSGVEWVWQLDRPGSGLQQ
nr:GNAT family N-acetyltransferase [Saccharopolyspora sp. HNM0983]